MVPAGAFEIWGAAFAGEDEFANDGEGELGEGGAPFGQQRFYAPWVHGEEELIVFAVAPGLIEAATGVAGA